MNKYQIGDIVGVYYTRQHDGVKPWSYVSKPYTYGIIVRKNCDGYFLLVSYEVFTFHDHKIKGIANRCLEKIN